MTTKAMKQRRERLVGIGCIACLNLDIPESPAEIHHLREGRGMSQRSDDKNAIPLCPNHHRIGGLGIAIHAGQETWEAIHGTERELLAQVNEIIGDERLM